MKVIPVLVGDAAHFDQRVELEGVTYALSFHWNARRSLWTLDVNAPGADFDDTNGVAGITVVANRFLLLRYHYRDGVPPGELLANDPTLALDGPGFDWSGFTFVYLTHDEAVTPA
jgi:hypothetical protein